MTRTKTLACVVVALAAACGDPSSSPLDAHVASDAPLDGDGSCLGGPAGAAGELPIERSVTKLVTDRARCRLIGLTGASLILVDVRTRTVEVVLLSAQASDFDLSADGRTLVVANAMARSLTLLDPDTLEVQAQIPTAATPWRVEATSYGRVFYVSDDATTHLYRVDLSPVVEVDVDRVTESRPGLELSADDRVLYVGGRGIPAAISAYGVYQGAFGVVSTSQGTDQVRNGDPRLAEVLLSPSGARVYYAGLQLDARSVGTVRAMMGEAVLAEDDAGTVAIGTGHVWDALTGQQAAALPAPIAAASVLDDEAWMYTPTTSSLRHVAVRELLGP